MNLANQITVLRILLVPLIVLLLIKFRAAGAQEQAFFRLWTVAAFAVSVLTDAFDGYIARRWNQKTRLGAILDPLADKLLLMSSILILCLPFDGMRVLPYWFLVVVISRDLLLVIGSVVVQIFFGNLKVAPSLLGKTTTVLQMATVMWILLGLPHPEYVWRAAGAATIASGVHYILRGTRQISDV